MALIDLDREAPTGRRTARHPARAVAALGVLVALVVLPGEHPAAPTPKPVSECTLFLGNGSGPRIGVVDPETGAVTFRMPPDEVTAVIMEICPD
ncbi:hypothetical protein [Asanoa ishikariensis]|nr:hypothetical protein [Asanoa ishikariensis]